MICVDSLSHTATSQAELVPFLTTLEDNNHFFAYDFGMITLIYDQIKLPQVRISLCRCCWSFCVQLNSAASTFTLEWLVSQPQIISRVMTQDPALSSPGLAFFMQTIAEYGDPAIGLAGVRTGSCVV